MKVVVHLLCAMQTSTADQVDPYFFLGKINDSIVPIC